MRHGPDLLERLPDKETFSKGLQRVVQEQARRQTDILTLCAERARRSRKTRELKIRWTGMYFTAEKGKLRGFL